MVQVNGTHPKGMYEHELCESFYVGHAKHVVTTSQRLDIYNNRQNMCKTLEVEPFEVGDTSL